MYKRGRISSNGTHQKRKLSTDNRKWKLLICGMKINVGNGDYHKRALSNENHHIVGGMLFCQCRVHKSGVSNPSMTQPRPF